MFIREMCFGWHVEFHAFFHSKFRLCVVGICIIRIYIYESMRVVLGSYTHTHTCSDSRAHVRSCSRRAVVFARPACCSNICVTRARGHIVTSTCGTSSARTSGTRGAGRTTKTSSTKTTLTRRARTSGTRTCCVDEHSLI